jgi:hypothetical protein
MAHGKHSKVKLDEVLELARQLSPSEKARLIEQVAPEAQHEVAKARTAAGASLLGLAKDLGPAPSADEIDAARAEAWSNFPRDTT